ncbi:MAG: 30S ribosomal protein S2 [Candidatus Gracilibacteria bacterium]
MPTTAPDKEKLLKEMIKNAVHFGHKPCKWNPKMKPYLYGKHDGVHVFDLNKTADGLAVATEFLHQCVRESKTVLFVSTKAQAIQIMKDTAEACGMPYITQKWVPGLLTNFTTIKKRIKYLRDLKEQDASGELDKYTKKEALKMRKTIIKLQEALGGLENLTKRPDVLFLVDVVRDHIAVEEANKLNIPIVAIVDSNGDPTRITHPIPGNDDAINSLDFLVKKIGGALERKK